MLNKNFVKLLSLLISTVFLFSSCDKITTSSSPDTSSKELSTSSEEDLTASKDEPTSSKEKETTTSKDNATTTSKQKNNSQKQENNNMTTSKENTTSKIPQNNESSLPEQSKETNLLSEFDIEPLGDDAYATSLHNSGNNSRIAALMKKAAKGGNYVIAVLGGSISAGSSASDIEKSYGFYVKEWWEDNFPKAKFKFVSAGIGGTNPQMACARLEADLLDYKPDFVVVDFNVNTGGDTDIEYTYASLIYRISTMANAPAMMSIQFTCLSSQASYGSMNPKKRSFNINDNIKKVVSNYNLPSINYGDYVWKEIGKRNIAWEDIAADYIHPNDNGHYIAGCLVANHLNYVKENLNKIDSKIVKYEAPDYLGYCEYKYITDGIGGTKVKGFTTIQNSKYNTYHGWKANTSGSTIKFTLPKNVNEIFVFGIVTGGTSGTITLFGNGDVKEATINIKDLAAPTFYSVSAELGNEITLVSNAGSALVRIYGIAYR